MGPGARLNSTRLGFRKTGKDRGAAGSDMARQRRRKRVQGAFEEIGEHEIGLAQPEPGMGKSVRRNHADQG